MRIVKNTVVNISIPAVWNSVHRLWTVSNEKRLRMTKVEPAPSAAFPAGGALNDSVRNKASVRTWLAEIVL